jgi:hypothetical protein
VSDALLDLLDEMAVLLEARRLRRQKYDGNGLRCGTEPHDPAVEQVLADYRAFIQGDPA